MKTILIVDDEPAARYGLRRALEGRYQIIEADSAAAARAVMASAMPDLLVLDIVMPGGGWLGVSKVAAQRRV